MNKKLFLGMFAAAGMLLATSCSNDELDMVQSGNEAQVTFSLAAEGGIATRAISDGKKADKLVWAVYNESGTLLNVFKDATGNYVGQSTETDVTDMTTTAKEVTVNLAKGQKYHVLFWAQDADCDAYDTDDLRNVEVKYPSTAKNNDELRDAFFACKKIEVKGNETFKVDLTRPFAQINVGVTAEDWNAAVAAGITVKQSKVVIKNVATHIDLLDGSVSGTQEVIYDFADIISDEDLKVDLNGDKDFDDANEVYKWLSMSYILVDEKTTGASKTNLESLEFTFAPDPEVENANNIIFKEGLNNVPVQRNWRTNILGKILTGTIKFEVMIDQEFLGDINIDAPMPAVVKNWDEFVAAVDAGEEYILLSNDISNDKTTYNLTKNVTIDLNDHTFTTGNMNTTWLNVMGSTSTFKNGVIEGKVYVQKNGSTFSNATFDGVTFGGTITFNNVTQGALAVQGGNSVYVKGCTFKAKGSTTPNIVSLEGTSSGSVVFEDCTFNSTMNRFYANPIGGTAIFKLLNCSFNKAAVVETNANWNLNNLTIDGSKKQNVNLYIGKAKENLSDEEKVILDDIKTNKISGTVYCNGVRY